jgi:hypothetical protein
MSAETVVKFIIILWLLIVGAVVAIIVMGYMGFFPEGL